MREIKFRAWDKENKKFFSPTYEAWAGRLEDLFIDLCGELHIHNISGIVHESLFPNRFILMQYTGLKDRHGKEIWEGDIVKEENCMGDILGDIRFTNGCFSVWYKDVPKGWAKQYIPIYDTMKFEEVIGNIYENPNLLEPDKCGGDKH